MIGIRPQHILPLLIPQVIELPDSRIRSQFCHDLVHDSLYIGFQVSVNLFPGCAGKPLTEAHQQGFHRGITVVSAVDLRHDFRDGIPPLLPELVTVLGLLLINMEHILRENLPCKCGAHLLHALVRQVSFTGYRGVGDHVDMGVMPFVMVGGIPPQMVYGYLQILRKSHGLAPQEIPPTASVIETQPGGILPPQREDRCVNMAGVFIQLLGYFT